MRIITGVYRGRKLEAPYGDDVRPTGDKVKEALFSMLMYHVEDAFCVDLFAGTGNLGLEALSRGARMCVFCDNSRDSIRYIKANIDHCGASQQSRVVAGDFMKALEHLREPVDLFFLDPPYGTDLYTRAIETIASLDLLAENGIIVAEHDKNQVLPDEIGGFCRFKVRKYGKVVLSLYSYPGKEEDDQ